MSAIACTACDCDSVPSHTYICSMLHATPVHKECMRQFAKCPFCSEHIIGVVRRDVLREESKEVASLSSVMLTQSRRFYKEWHLQKLHAKRKKAQFSRQTTPSLENSKLFYSSAFGCLDWVESAPEQKEQHEEEWKRNYETVDKYWKAKKEKIKKWFSGGFHHPVICDVCQYLFEAGSLEGSRRAALPSTRCRKCGIGLCKTCLESLYSADEWKKLLSYGRPENQPSLMMRCSGAQCNVEFCKFRLFEDEGQLFELNLDGPQGASPVSQCCLMSALPGHPDYDTESLICEIDECIGLGFCSMECKRSHCRRCKDCGELFHVTAATEKRRCLVCQTERNNFLEEKASNEPKP